MMYWDLEAVLLYQLCEEIINLYSFPCFENYDLSFEVILGLGRIVEHLDGRWVLSHVERRSGHRGDGLVILDGLVIYLRLNIVK